jgi:hypothetical protein
MFICPFEFQKRSQLFIRSHDETLSAVAVRVSNKDRPAMAIDSGKAARTPFGLAESELESKTNGLRLQIFTLARRCTSR